MKQLTLTTLTRKLIITSGLILALTGCDKIQDLPVGKGFSAKYLCSYLFNSGLDESLIKSRFIAPKVQPLPLIWDIDIDAALGYVTVGEHIFLNEYLKGRALYREGMGCTLLADRETEDLQAHTITPLPAPELPADLPWPHGTAGTDTSELPALDKDQLAAAMELAFTEPEEVPLNTTSLLVAYNGRLIGERYALGANKDTPLLGWSMTKTISGTLIGILWDQGLLDLDAPAPIPGWAGTDKNTVTTRDIVHMTSGLDFEEDYGTQSGVTQMLYLSGDQIDYVASQPLAHEPGTYFNYSTGDANLLAKIVHDMTGGTAQSAYNFYQNALFHKLGIGSAFIEVDAVGQFVGGAYGFMTPRDWLRMGQLYLQRGQWNGQQVVSSAWIDYVTQPSPVTDIYGGQIWLNSRGNEWPELPHDTYYFAGHQGQRVIVIPSENLVVTRTGVTEDYDYLNLGPTISAILEVIRQARE